MNFTKEELDKAQTAFIRARIHLLSTKPFYAHLVMKLKLQWADTPGGLSATDGENIYITPTTFLRLSEKEQASVLVHEVLHCAAGHLFRRGARDPWKWNVAGDVYIANVIEAEGFEPVQAGEAFLQKLGINRLEFLNATTDAIYAAIPDWPQQQSSGKSKSGQSDSGRGHSHWNGNGEKDGCFSVRQDAGERSQQENKWKQAVIEAGQLAGDAHGAWQELVKAAMPKPPFHLKLFEYLNRGLGGDSDWSCLNRRYIYQGLYFPTDTRVVMGRVAIAVDTSGSMDTATQLVPAFGYIRGFREQHPCTLDLIQCDWRMPEGAGHVVYAEHEPLPDTFKVEGRGGTSFNPPFALLREKRIEPKVLIYLMDGYGDVNRTSRPNYPVLWVVLGGNEHFKPPFGEVLHVN